MTLPPHLSRLTDAERDEVRRVVSMLTAGSGSADLEGLAANCSLSVRPAAIVELVAADLSRRWGAGEKLLLDDYLPKFPELLTSEGFPHLILTEFEARRRHGENPAPSTYRMRFPQHATVVDRLLPSSSSSASALSGSVPRSMDPPGPQSGYQMRDPIGRGRFGEVWRASAPGGVDVAIKLVPQAGDRDTAAREIQALELVKNLRHPHLLPIYAFWVESRHLHIVMELADGTLRTRLDECRKQGLPGIPRDELLKAIGEAAKGLDFLHQRNVFHRDVKPDNIVLVNGYAKVADFGLARQQEQLLASMSFAGTPAYMAPEVWGGEGGPASDQYGLAFTYAELRQGRSPLPPGPLSEVMIAHLDGRLEFAEFIRESERRVLRKAMARSPEERYPSCVAFVKALIAARTEDLTSTNPSLPIPTPESPAALAGDNTLDSSLSPMPANADDAVTPKVQPPSPPPVSPPSPVKPPADIGPKVSPTPATRPAKPPRPSPTIVPTSHQEYEIVQERVLGRGLFATVYRGRNVTTRHDVAVKALLPEFQNDPDRLAEFQDAARLYADLPEYDHLVRVLDFVPEKGWLALELMHGSLADGLARTRAGLNPDQIRVALRQALRGLQTLHEQGRYHGAIKPSNLLVDNKGRVKLGDSPGLFVEGVGRTPEGLPKYAAPERINNQFGPLGAGTDLYTLGFTILELLVGPNFDEKFKGCGRSAPDANSAWMRIHGSADESIPPATQLLPRIPPDLARVIDRLLQKRVENRYTSAAEAIADLDGGVRSPSVKSPPAPPAPRQPVAPPANPRPATPPVPPPTAPPLAVSPPKRPSAPTFDLDPIELEPRSPVQKRPVKPGFDQAPSAPPPRPLKPGPQQAPPPRPLPSRPQGPRPGVRGGSTPRYPRPGSPPPRKKRRLLLPLLLLVFLGTAGTLSVIYWSKIQSLIGLGGPTTVRITTNPDGARITFLDPNKPDAVPNDKETPNDYPVQDGEQRIRIEKPGYQTREETINPRQTRDYQFTLAPNDAVAVKLTTEPAGATVTVDGQVVGQTPCDVVLKKGKHTVLVTKDEYFSEYFEPEVDLTSTAPPIPRSLKLNKDSRSVKVKIVTHKESGFEVRVDGIPIIGTSPVEFRLDPGTYNFTILKPGYEREHRTLVIGSGAVFEYQWETRDPIPPPPPSPTTRNDVKD